MFDAFEFEHDSVLNDHIGKIFACTVTFVEHRKQNLCGSLDSLKF